MAALITAAEGSRRDASWRPGDRPCLSATVRTSCRAMSFGEEVEGLGGQRAAGVRGKLSQDKSQKYLMAVIDSAGSVSEDDETNNRAIKSLS